MIYSPRACKKLRYEGRTQMISAWALERGLTAQTLWHRLYRLGWPIDEALNTPAWKRRNPKPAAKRRQLKLPPPWSFVKLLERYRGPAVARAVRAGMVLAEAKVQERLHG